jgi:hypothetical protein
MEKILRMCCILGILCFATVTMLPAQQVHIKLDESTYSVAADKLKAVGNGLIDQKMKTLKANSWKVQANIVAVGEDYEAGSLNYKMEVMFLHKETYTADVRSVHFSLVDGETRNVKVVRPPLTAVKVVEKEVLSLDCKMKQGILIKRDGILKLKKAKVDPGRVRPRRVTDRPIAMSRTATQLKKMNLKDSVKLLQKAELSKLLWWTAKGLATTPCDTIPTAVSGTQTVYKTFGLAFGTANAAMRLGSPCTVNGVAGFLKYDSNLLAWNHIGHGWPGGLVMWDGSLTAAIMQTLSPHNGIYCAVALINSCNTFNDPLKAGFLANHPRTYIAGAISLPIGPSEKVDMCFWREVLLNKTPMADALAECSKKYNLAGAFGLAGDGGLFW